VLRYFWERAGALLLAALLVPAPANANIVTLPYPLVSGTVASAPQVMADFTTLYTLVNGNLDATNLALTGGIYANQIIPTNASQATFGGTQTYAFPQSITVGNNISALDGFLSTSLTSNSGAVYFGTAGVAKLDFGVTTSGTFTFSSGNVSVTNQLNANGGFLENGASVINGTLALSGVLTASSQINAAAGTLTAGLNDQGTALVTGLLTASGSSNLSGNVNILGAIDQKVGSNFYTIPYDGSGGAIAGDHYEAGTLTTATISSGFGCVSHTFNQPFPTATPRLFYSAESLVGIPAGPFTLYTNGRSATSFQACVQSYAGGSSGTATFDWLAIAE